LRNLRCELARFRFKGMENYLISIPQDGQLGEMNHIIISAALKNKCWRGSVFRAGNGKEEPG